VFAPLGMMMACVCFVKRRQAMVKLDCMKSLLALAENESGAVVEMALHTLANHVRGDQQMKFAVNVSP